MQYWFIAILIRSQISPVLYRAFFGMIFYLEISVNSSLIGELMKKHTIIAVVLGATMLTACGSKEDANEKNFAAAMTQYFDHKGDLCLGVTRWPLDLSEAEVKSMDKNPNGQAAQMAALAAAGLVQGQDAEVEAVTLFGKPTGKMLKVKRYTLTDNAKPFVQEREPLYRIGNESEALQDLCWGKKALNKVEKWEGPMSLGEYQEALVIYTYKVDNVAEWAQMPEIQTVFPTVKRTLEGAAKTQARHGVKLTSEGWEPKGLN